MYSFLREELHVRHFDGERTLDTDLQKVFTAVRDGQMDSLLAQLFPWCECLVYLNHGLMRLCAYKCHLIANKRNYQNLRYKPRGPLPKILQYYA